MALIDLLKFVTTGAWGTGVARPLTAAEADTNVHSLADAIQDLIDNPVAGVSVSNIAVVGQTVTFYMSDATSYGPFDLPVAQPQYRGAWTPLEVYYPFDIVSVTAQGTYMVGVGHTAAATFDPAASNSAGDYYIQIAPSNVEASSEETGATLTVNSTHFNTFVECTNAAGTAITLPATADEDTQITFRQGAEFPLTFTVAGGGTIKGMFGYDNMTDGEGSVVTCKFRDGAWRMWGRLAAVSA